MKQYSKQKSIRVRGVAELLSRKDNGDVIFDIKKPLHLKKNDIQLLCEHNRYRT